MKAPVTQLGLFDRGILDRLSPPEGRWPGRIVAWFSCGSTSAVAAALAMRWAQRHDVEGVVAYCDTSSTEHPDNLRFLADCEKWIGQPILRLRSKKYRDTWHVWKERRYLVGIAGAPCTLELKKRVRQRFERPFDDVQVFGYESDSKQIVRAERFDKNNPEARLWTPLIDVGLTKSDCMSLLDRAGIELPEMYKLGYQNNNCIGCVKGGSGYWNKIRVDFPAVFARMAKLERELDVAINKTQPVDPVTKKRKRLRVFLDELDPDAGSYEDEPSFECGVLCEETAVALEEEACEL